MTEQAQSPFTTEEWMKTQRAYWDAWADLCKKSQGAAATLSPGPGGEGHPAFSPAFAAPWTEAMDKWWQAMAPTAPKESRGFFEHLVGQGKDFFRVSEEFTKLCNCVNQAGQGAKQWQDALRQQIDQMKGQFSGPGLAGLADPLRAPMEQWLKGLGQMSPLPQGLAQGLNAKPWDKTVCEMHAQFLRFLSLPGIGVTRETQEDVQLVLRAFVEFEETLNEYINAHGQIAPLALDLLYRRIVEMQGKKHRIETLREIYDLWIDCLEITYRDFVMTKEFSVLYGRLVNRMMTYRKAMQTLVNEVLGLLDIPVREDVEALVRQIHTLRRTVHEMEAQAADASPDPGQAALTAEVAALRAQMEAPPAVDPGKAALTAEVGALRAEVVELRTLIQAAQAQAAQATQAAQAAQTARAASASAPAPAPPLLAPAMAAAAPAPSIAPASKAAAAPLAPAPTRAAADEGAGPPRKKPPAAKPPG
jgi:class III poly(R)-hydroxyalkanoic acid synthase PhaE subunit